jgi:cytochrome c peroxidase
LKRRPSSRLCLQRLLLSLLIPVCIVWSAEPASSNPLSARRVALGKTLFFDARLSSDGSVSCATCHDPATAFTSRESRAIGVNGQIGTRNIPTVLNVAYLDSYFWDGRVRTLEEQAKQPLLSGAEMGTQMEAALVQRLGNVSAYRKSFRDAFPQRGITLETIAQAIAAFERTLISRNAPFDRFIQGNVNAITENQKKGWELFRGKARCIECHQYSAASPFFTDSKFYNTGIVAREQQFSGLQHRAEEIRLTATGVGASVLAHNQQFAELGRFLVTGQPKDIGAFRTPALRDIELTWPYMHDGSLSTLLDVVRFYNRGGNVNLNLDPKMRPLNLTDEEMNGLVEFMRALTSENVLREAQAAKPQIRRKS